MGDHRIVFGNVEDVLASLEAGSVDCCITSPPYWGLRSYSDDPREIGKEATPEEYVERLVGVFAEVRRVLKDSGTLWLNLGDSYASGKGTCFNPGGGEHSLGQDRKAAGVHPLDRGSVTTLRDSGLKPKDLCGIPWRVAFALQADGWWLRNAIVWAKPNAMPESCKDRFSCKYEHVFLLAKSARYWFDLDAIREPNKPDHWRQTTPERQGEPCPKWLNDGGEHSLRHDWYKGTVNNPLGKNPGDVWTIPTQPTPFAHFATFPEALVERCLLAGCPPQVCAECGEPWEHRVEVTGVRDDPQREGRTAPAQQFTGERYEGRETLAKVKDVRDLGYFPACDCGTAAGVPGLVLDPFAGSGTVAAMARKHGRRSIGIELQREYEKVIRQRLDLGGMFDEVEFEDADNLAPVT